MIVQRFTQSEIADAQMDATGYFVEWTCSEVGMWVFEHSLTQPCVHLPDDPYGTNYMWVIDAELSSEDELYFIMRWGHEIRY